MRDRYTRTMRRFMDDIGRDVTLVNQSAQTDSNGDPQRDSYNDIKWDSKTETATTAEVMFQGEESFERRADGVDEDIDIIVLVADDDAADVTDGEDDEATRATRIKIDGDRYTIRETIDQANGVVQCHCHREED